MTLRTQLSQARKELEIVKEENAKLKDDSETLNPRNSDINTTAPPSSSSSSPSATAPTSTTTQQASSDLINVNAKLGEEVASLRVQLSMSRSSLKKSERLTSLQTSTISNLEGEVEGFKSTIEAVNKELDAIRVECKRLTEERDEAIKIEREMIERVVSEKQKTAEQVQNITEMLDRVVKECAWLREEGEKKDKRIKELEDMVGVKDVVKEFMEETKAASSTSGNFFLSTTTIVPTTLLSLLRPHTTEVTSLNLLPTSPDTTLTTSSDGTAKIITKGVVKGNLMPGGGRGLQPVICGDIGPHICAVGSVDKTISVYPMSSSSLSSGTIKPKLTLQGHGAKVTSVRCMQGSSSNLLSASQDRTVKVWDLQRGGGIVVGTMRSRSQINCMDCPKVGKGTFGTCHQDGGVRVWDIKMGGTAAELSGVHEGPASFFRYGRDESVVVSMGRAGDIKVIDLRVGKVLHNITHPEFRPPQGWGSFAISPDGKYIAAGGGTGELFVFDITKERLVTKLGGHRGPVTGIAWGAGENQVTSGDKSGNVVIWK